MPNYRHGCRNVGAVVARYWGWLLKQSFSFSTSLDQASGILPAILFKWDGLRDSADRHNPGHRVPPLQGGHRLPGDDRIQGWAVRLPPLLPHGAAWRLRIQVHMPLLLETKRSQEVLIQRSEAVQLFARNQRCQHAG